MGALNDIVMFYKNINNLDLFLIFFSFVFKFLKLCDTFSHTFLLNFSKISTTITQQSTFSDSFKQKYTKQRGNFYR